MPFPTVKSDEYKKPKPYGKLGPLWPESVWNKICEAAESGMDWVYITVDANNRLPEKYRKIHSDHVTPT